MALDYRIFKTLIKNIEYFENKPHIAVGVSGGPDSMALAYLLNKWIEYKGISLSENIQVKKKLLNSIKCNSI